MLSAPAGSRPGLRGRSGGVTSRGFSLVGVACLAVRRTTPMLCGGAAFVSVTERAARAASSAARLIASTAAVLSAVPAGAGRDPGLLTAGGPDGAGASDFVSGRPPGWRSSILTRGSGPERCSIRSNFGPALNRTPSRTSRFTMGCGEPSFSPSCSLVRV